MIICVDVGNTTILFGVYDNEKLIDTFRMETKVLKTSDEYGSSLLAHFQLVNINKLDKEEQLIISAIEKQKDIKKMYQKNNIEFNPLIIIQIPDNINIDADIKTEDQLLKKIDSILEKYNYKKSYNYAI